MLKINNANAGDVFNLAGAVKGMKGQPASNDFKNLLGEALQSPGKTTPSKEKPAKPTKNMEASEPLTPETQEQPVAVDPTAAAAAMAVQQPVEPLQHGEQGQAAQPAQAAAQSVQAVPQQAMPQLVPTAPVVTDPVIPATQQGAEADIISVQASVIDPQGEVAVPAQPTAPATQPSETVTEAPVQDRFGNMLDQAQQQLQEYQNPPQINLTDQEIAETQDIEAPEIQIPQATDEADTLMEPAPLPAEMADKFRIEVIKTPRPPVEVQPMDQKPLKEMPERDRTVMDMRETAAVIEPKPPENIQVERAPEPTRAPEPQTFRQPQVPDQAEQIRNQVTENLNRSNMEFRMQLNPQELGKIDVKMVIEGGRLAVEIMAAGTRTADLLHKQVDSLVHALRVHTGMDVTSVQVVTQSQSTDSHMDGAFNMLNGQAQNGGYQGQSQSQGGRGTSAATTQTAAGTEQFVEDGEEQDAPEMLLNYAI